MENSKFYTVRGYQLLEQNKNLLTASLEDYLEMIYRSITNDGYIRVNELANELNVNPSSVSKMIMKLTNLGLIDYEKYGVIKLTQKGEEIGKYLLWRHNIINEFFNLLCDKTPEQNFIEAELVEHLLNKETVKNIENLLNFFYEKENLRDSFNLYKQNRLI